MKRMLAKLKTYFIPHQENDFKPHFFATTSVLALAGAMTALFLLAAVQHISLLRGNGMLASVISSVLVDITNEDRAEYGKGGLNVNPLLVEAAQLKANDMAAKSYFAHTSPEGVTPWHWLNQAGYAFSYAGENLAVNFSDSIDVGQAWMDSPGHRANILNGQFTEIGIATAEGVYEGAPTIFVVQFFGKPATASSTHGVVVAKETQTVVPGATETATTTSVTEVAGATLETVTVDDMFVAVRTSDVAGAEVAAEDALLAPAPQGSLLARVVTSPKTTLAYAYLIFGLLIVVALALDTFIEVRRRHPIHIVYALLLWILLIGLLYAGGEYLFPQVVVG